MRSGTDTCDKHVSISDRARAINALVTAREDCLKQAQVINDEIFELTQEFLSKQSQLSAKHKRLLETMVALEESINQVLIRRD